MPLDRTMTDEKHLQPLIEKAVGEFSAGYGGVMIALGHKLASTGQWTRPGRSRAPSSRPAPAAPSAMCASG
jgi:hypothetical protein